MRLLKLLLVASALVLTPLAFADTFHFSGYAGPGFDGYPGITVDGTFTATPGFQGLSNVWEVTSIAGTVINPNSTVTAITGLIPDPTYTPITADGFIFDNLYYSSLAELPSFSVPYATAHGLDFWGVLFSTADGNYVNLFSNVGGPVYATDDYAYTNTAYFENSADPGISVVATPEPSSLILLGTGALGLATGLRRKIAARV